MGGRLSSLLAEQRTTDVHLRSGPQLLQYRSIAARIAADRPGRLLDWGCGYGQVTQLLREAGVDAVPFDFRPELEEVGVRPLERYPELEAHVSPDPVRLPFADASFDSVLSCGVLEHVSDPEGSVAEIARVLRPDGRFYVFNLPNRYSYLERVARVLGVYYHGALPDDRVYTTDSASGLLERHGFQVERARRATMLPLRVPGAVGTRGARPIWLASRALERVPGLNIVATSLELVATRDR
ncbi:MAG: class I SAM-dependent methyltransferase [Dehalococcoidia bacterium]